MAGAVARAVDSLLAGATDLDLRGAGIGPAELGQIAEALGRCQSVRRIDLSGNERLGDAGCAALAEAVRANASLTEINLARTGVTAVGIHQLSKKLKESDAQRARVRAVNLEDNPYGPGGPAPLYKTLAIGSTLRDLALSGLDSAGAERLCQAMREGATPLEWLRLSRCAVDGAFAAQLASVMAMQNGLVGLQLGDWFSAEALAVLFTPLRDAACQLQALDLMGAVIDHRVAREIAVAFCTNRSLRTLRLLQCTVASDASLGLMLAQALARGSSVLERVEGFFQPPELVAALQANAAASMVARSAPTKSSDWGAWPEPQHPLLNQAQMPPQPPSQTNIQLPSHYVVQGEAKKVDSCGPAATTLPRTPAVDGPWAISKSCSTWAAGSGGLPARQAATRFINVAGKLKEKAYIAMDPFKPQLAVATQAQNKYNQVTLVSVPGGKTVSVVRLGRKVGAIAFDPFSGNLVVATASGQSQLLCYEYHAEDNCWTLIWKKPLYGYGSHVESMAVHRCGVFLKLTSAPAEASLPSRFLVYLLEKEQLHALACDDELFPRCRDVFVFPDCSALMVRACPRREGLLFSTQLLRQLNDHFAVPDKCEMASGALEGTDESTSLVVCTPKNVMLILSWEKKDTILQRFQLTLYELDAGTAPAGQQRLPPYVAQRASAVGTVRCAGVMEIRGLPEVTQVQGASIGHGDVLNVLLVERVKMPGKKWFLYKRFVFTLELVLQ